MSMMISPYAFAAAGGTIGNAATLSPNWNGGVTLSNGNLTAAHTGAAAYQVVGSLAAKLTGKWYFEVTINTLGGSAEMLVGIGDWGERINNFITSGSNSSTCHAVSQDNRLLRTGLGISGGIGTWAANDVISVAFDATGRTAQFRRNGGTWTSANAVGGTRPMMPLIQLYYATDQVTCNFGATSFAYTPPSGYSAWEETTIEGRYWRAQTFLGTGLGQNIAEISMRLTSGGANQRGSGTASASSEFTPPTYNAAKAVDGNVGTWWSSNGEQNTAWWQYDFGSGVTKAIREIVETKRNDGNSQQVTQRAYLYSANGTDFFPARAAYGLSWTNGEAKTFAVG